MPGGSEQKEQPKKKVLKLSEMALSVSGEYVGECGNSSYADRKDFFEYVPGTGLLIKGTRIEAVLSPDDLVALYHDFGHVPVKDFFRADERFLSQSDFMGRQSEFFKNMQRVLQTVLEMARALGVKLRGGVEMDADHAIKMAYDENPQYSPQDLTEALVQDMKRELGRAFDDEATVEEKAKQLDGLKAVKILDLNRENRQAAMPDYFYLWARAKGVDISDSDKIRQNAFGQFSFLDDLLAEYRRQPDGRFGDALLVACEEECREQK